MNEIRLNLNKAKILNMGKRSFQLLSETVFGVFILLYIINRINPTYTGTLEAATPFILFFSVMSLIYGISLIHLFGPKTKRMNFRSGFKVFTSVLIGILVFTFFLTLIERSIPFSMRSLSQYIVIIFLISLYAVFIEMVIVWLRQDFNFKRGERDE